MRDWYVGASGHVKRSFYDWKVRIPGPRGFGVLVFKSHEGTPFIITLSFDGTKIRRRVTLEAPPYTATLFEVIDACKARQGLPQPILVDSDKQSTRTEDGTLISLTEGRYAYESEFLLEISPA